MPSQSCQCACKMCRAPGALHCTAHPLCGAPRTRLAPAVSRSYPESEVIELLAGLRAESGSHAPSVGQLEQALPGLVRLDACFLANPYATAEVLTRFRAIPAAQLERMVSHYPTQAHSIAAQLAPHLGVPAAFLHLANGATEVIAAVLASNPGPVLLSQPTFSAYHEFARGPVLALQLEAAEDFRLDLGRLEDMVRRHSPRTVVIINPNNPDGGLIPHDELVRFVERVHSRVGQIIVDESFSHFTGEEQPTSLASLVPLLPRLVVVNSLSKNYGIAGLRLGYAVMSAQRAHALRQYALWNVNAFAEWFCTLLGESGFQRDYERARRRYVRDTAALFTGFRSLPNAKVYPSAANFALLELARPADEVAGALLARHGIYVRDCADKRGLEGGQFIRVASRTQDENRRILAGLREVLARPAELPMPSPATPGVRRSG